MQNVVRPPTIVGVFADHARAVEARDALRAAGFPTNVIGTRSPDGEGTAADPILQGASAPTFEQLLQDGRSLLAVEPPERVAEAVEIIRRHGGQVSLPSATSNPNDPSSITDTVQSTAERYPSPSQPIRASRSIPRAGIGPNLQGDLDEPVLPNDVSERPG